MLNILATVYTGDDLDLRCFQKTISSEVINAYELRTRKIQTKPLVWLHSKLTTVVDKKCINCPKAVTDCLNSSPSVSWSMVNKYLVGGLAYFMSLP